MIFFSFTTLACVIEDLNERRTKTSVHAHIPTYFHIKANMFLVPVFRRSAQVILSMWCKFRDIFYVIDLVMEHIKRIKVWRLDQ